MRASRLGSPARASPPAPKSHVERREASLSRSATPAPQHAPRHTGPSPKAHSSDVRELAVYGCRWRPWLSMDTPAASSEAHCSPRHQRGRATGRSMGSVEGAEGVERARRAPFPGERLTRHQGWRSVKRLVSTP